MTSRLSPIKFSSNVGVRVTQFPTKTLLGKRPAARCHGLELQQAFRIAMRDLGHFFGADWQGIQKGSPLGVGAEWVIHREKDPIGADDL
jgi:hypothetical protein